MTAFCAVRLPQFGAPQLDQWSRGGGLAAGRGVLVQARLQCPGGVKIVKMVQIGLPGRLFGEQMVEPADQPLPRLVKAGGHHPGFA
ncbi:hypothetical protein NP284_20990 [Rhodopseudomonas pseudopalustris]|uniref:hypothetical protein n=1 Tax=Rhodopseudomonas pseudopalustris TaxID=1513892 RepID=UPI003F97AA98